MYDYRKQLSWAKLRVGAVVTAGLLVLFFAVLFAGTVERLLSPRVTITSLFSDVKGLRAGAPVWFAGVQVGSVRSLSFTTDEKITVALSIKREVLNYLKADSRASILTLGLLGDKYIEISMGTRDSEPLKAGGMITGITRPEIGEELSQLFDRIESEKGTLGRLLTEDKLYRDLSVSARDIQRFARTLRTSEGTVNKLVKDPAMYERFLKASESLDAFTRRLTASKGTLSRLVEDKSLYENMDSAAAKLNAVLDKIEKGEGAMGSLISDRELKEDLRATVKELSELVKDIKKNPKKYFEFSIF